MGIRDTLADVVSGAVDGVADGLMKAARRRGGLDEDQPKAEASTPWPETGKVGQRGAPLRPEAHNLRGQVFDPDLLYMQGSGTGDYLEKVGGVSWKVLDTYSKVPACNAVIQWILRQTVQFAVPQVNRHQPGHQIRLRDANATMTRAARKRANEIQRFMTYGGVLTDPREVFERTPLETAFYKVGRDAMVYDQMCVQVAHTRSKVFGGREVPARFEPWSAASVRLAMPPEDGGMHEARDFERAAFVQVDSYDRIIEEFTATEMLFGVRYPSTDLDRGGYGWSEVEQAIDTMVSFLYGYGRNKLFFKQGYNANGILNFEGEAPTEEQKRGFRQLFQQSTMGVGNSHRLPLTWGSKAQFIDLNTSHREMEYSAWMDYNVKLICALFGVDPSVINMTFGNQGQSSGLGNVDPTERRAQSMVMAVFPLVRAIFRLLNDGLIYQFDPDFQMVPTGIGVRTEEQELDYLKKKAELVPIDRILKEMDEEPLGEDKAGDYILSSNYIQARAAAEAPDEGDMMEGGEGGGDLGEANFDEGDDDQGDGEDTEDQGDDEGTEDGDAKGKGSDAKGANTPDSNEDDELDGEAIAAQLFGETTKKSQAHGDSAEGSTSTRWVTIDL